MGAGAGSPAAVTVPCGSCHLCCKMMTPLDPAVDDIKSYDHGIWVDRGRIRGVVLARKENGDCVYLTEQGCSIHYRAPAICRKFDCRANWRNSNRGGRRIAIKAGLMTQEIFNRGRELTEAAEGGNDVARPR